MDYKSALIACINGEKVSGWLISEDSYLMFDDGFKFVNEYGIVFDGKHKYTQECLTDYKNNEWHIVKLEPKFKEGEFVRLPSGRYARIICYKNNQYHLSNGIDEWQYGESELKEID